MAQAAGSAAAVALGAWGRDGDGGIRRIFAAQGGIHQFHGQERGEDEAQDRQSARRAEQDLARDTGSLARAASGGQRADPGDLDLGPGRHDFSYDFQAASTPEQQQSGTGEYNFRPRDMRPSLRPARRGRSPPVRDAIAAARPMAADGGGGPAPPPSFRVSRGLPPVTATASAGKQFFRDGQAAKLRLAAVKTFSKIVKTTYELQH